MPQTKDWVSDEYLKEISTEIVKMVYAGYGDNGKCIEWVFNYLKPLLHSELNRQKEEWIEKIDKMWLDPPWSAQWTAESYKIDGYRRAIRDVIQSLEEKV